MPIWATLSCPFGQIGRSLFFLFGRHSIFDEFIFILKSIPLGPVAPFFIEFFFDYDFLLNQRSNYSSYLFNAPIRKVIRKIFKAIVGPILAFAKVIAAICIGS